MLASVDIVFVRVVPKTRRRDDFITDIETVFNTDVVVEMFSLPKIQVWVRSVVVLLSLCVAVCALMHDGVCVCVFFFSTTIR